MKESISNFMNNMNSLSERDYMFSLIIYGIAPTICGYKSSSLITLSNKYKNTYRLWNTYKEEFLKGLPLKYFELNESKEAVTVLFYDEDTLSKKIKQKEYVSFLKSFGYYENETIYSCLYKLKDKYKEGCPHEIGLFLDIPVMDVLGFIRNKGTNFLYCGYWKVYNNLEDALKIFERYTRSKKRVIELLGQGKDSFQIIRELREYKAQ